MFPRSPKMPSDVWALLVKKRCSKRRVQEENWRLTFLKIKKYFVKFVLIVVYLEMKQYLTNSFILFI